jgi:hypothetical protein
VFDVAQFFAHLNKEKRRISLLTENLNIVPAPPFLNPLENEFGFPVGFVALGKNFNALNSSLKKTPKKILAKHYCVAHSIYCVLHSIRSTVWQRNS